MCIRVTQKNTNLEYVYDADRNEVNFSQTNSGIKKKLRSDQAFTVWYTLKKYADRVDVHKKYFLNLSSHTSFS